MSRSCSFSRRFSMLVIMVGWLLTAVTVVSAEERVNTQRQLSGATSSDSFAGQCYGRRAVEVYLPMSGGDFEVVVIPDSVTVVNFPRWVTLDKAEFAFEGFDVVQRPHQVVVAPLKGTPSGARANVAIKADKFAAVMNARLGSESDWSGFARRGHADRRSSSGRVSYALIIFEDRGEHAQTKDHRERAICVATEHDDLERRDVNPGGVPLRTTNLPFKASWISARHAGHVPSVSTR